MTMISSVTSSPTTTYLVTGALGTGLAWWLYKVTYNVFFSPLRHIPGPLIAQLFPRWWSMVHEVRGRIPFVELELHLQYGPTVRTGWDTVLFASEEAHREIYSTHRYRKGPFYEFLQLTGETTFSTRDKDFHRQRKRMLMATFNSGTIEAMEGDILEHGLVPLLRRLRGSSNDNDHTEATGENKKLADLYSLFGAMTLDVIGAVSFGVPFHALARTEPHPILNWISQSVTHILLQFFFPPVKLFLPNWGQNKLDRLTLDAVHRARDAPTASAGSPPSLISNLVHHAVDQTTGEKLSERDVMAEAQLQIIAGTESTSGTLTWVFYLLLKNPECYQRVVEEILDTFPLPKIKSDDKEDIISYGSIKGNKLPYVNAAIKEAMRVLPSGAGALDRIVPPGGRTIHGYYIPEGTLVGVNILSLHNLPSIWGDDAAVFQPERWLHRKPSSTSSNDKDKTGGSDDSPSSSPRSTTTASDVEWENFHPFSVGPRACLGRHLAMMEIQLTVVNLIRQFDFNLIYPDQKLTPVTSAFLKPKENRFEVWVNPRTS